MADSAASQEITLPTSTKPSVDLSTSAEVQVSLQLSIKAGELTVNGNPVNSTGEGVLTLVVPDQAQGVGPGEFSFYDLNNSTANVAEFVRKIGALAPGVIIGLAIKATATLPDSVVAACRLVGSASGHLVGEGDAWVCIGRKGCAPGSAAEERVAESTGGPAEVSVSVAIPSPSVITLLARAAPDQATVILNGSEVAVTGGYQAGLNVVVISPLTGLLFSSRSFPTSSSATQAWADFSNFVTDLEYGAIVAIVSQGDGWAGLTASATAALGKLGGPPERLPPQGAGAIVGVVGLSPSVGGATVAAGSPAEVVYWHDLEAWGPLGSLRIKLGAKSGARPLVQDGNGIITVNGVAPQDLNPAWKIQDGLNLVAIDEINLEFRDFGVFSTAAQLDSLRDFVLRQTAGTVLLGLGRGEILQTGGATLQRYCAMFGSTNLGGSGEVWSLIGRKGSAPGSVPEVRGSSELCLGAWLALPNSELKTAIRDIAVGASAATRVGRTAPSANSDDQLSLVPDVKIVDGATGQQIWPESLRDVLVNQAGPAETVASKMSELARVLANAPDDAVIAAAVPKGGSAIITTAVVTAFENIGSEYIASLTVADSWCFVTRKDSLPVFSPNNGNDANNEFNLQTSWIDPVRQEFTASTDTCPLTYRFVLDETSATNDWFRTCGAAGAGNGLYTQLRHSTSQSSATTSRAALQLAFADGEGQHTPVQITLAPDLEQQAWTDVALAIEGAEPGAYVVLTACGSILGQITERAKLALDSVGSAGVREVEAGGAWVLFGMKGSAPGTALERWSAGAPVRIAITLPVIRIAPRGFIFAVLLPVLAVFVIVVAIIVVAEVLYTPRPKFGQNLLVDVDPHADQPNFPSSLENQTMIVAHNAMCNPTDGWSKTQQYQSLSIKELLTSSKVRGFQIDVCEKTIAGVVELVLWHGSQTWNVAGPTNPKLLRDALREIVAFLAQNLREQVVLFIENPADFTPTIANNLLIEQALKASGAMHYVFWPDSTDAVVPAAVPASQIGQVDPIPRAVPPALQVWPKWVPAPRPPLLPGFPDDRRLFMFVDVNRGNGTPTAALFDILPFQWRYVQETEFSDSDLQGASKSAPKERAQSARRMVGDRSLLMLDYFPLLSQIVPYNYDRFLCRMQSAAVAFGKVPNFLHIDFANSRDAEQLIKDINKYVWRSPNRLQAMANMKTRDIKGC